MTTNPMDGGALKNLVKRKPSLGTKLCIKEKGTPLQREQQSLLSNQTEILRIHICVQ